MWRSFLLPVIAIAGLLAGGCGDDGGEQRTAVSTSPTATATSVSPEALAQSIYSDFVALHKELATILAGSPPAADLKPKVSELKNRYIERFVGYGRIRDTMSQTDAAKVESETRRLLFASPTVNIDALSQAVQRFNSTDPALAKELTSLNVITQYAFFELLQKQEPEEAKRLGID
jgi:hypothetical protein